MSIADIANNALIVEKNTPKVYESGRKFEHDRFWDTFQQYGNRTNYSWRDQPYSGHLHFSYWSMDNFYPKYDIKPTDMYGMFYYWTVGNHPGVNDWDLAKRLKDCGVVLDTSSLISPAGAFDHTHFTHIPYCDFSNCTPTTYTVGPFEYCAYVEKIDGIKVAETTYIYRWFVRCAELVDCPIEGVIGQNGLDLHWSIKLSHDSHVSIFNALSTATTGLTVTFSRTAVNKAFETSEGANNGSASSEWLSLVAAHNNWTISLA